MSSSSKEPKPRRSNKVFVQVPPSPHNLDDYHPLNSTTHSGTRSKLKENTPLQPLSFSMASQNQSTASIKRKMSDADVMLATPDDGTISNKKQKTSATKGLPLNSSQANGSTPLSETTAEYPNGWTYCHQCNKKRDLGGVIRCTSVEQVLVGKTKEPRQRQCSHKYCKFCLKNRYDADFEALVQARDTFICPKCRDVCNCPKCRKAKGLEAIGFISKPKQEGPAKDKKQKGKAANSPDAGDCPKVKPSKVLPLLHWVPLPHSITQEEAEVRIFIREFMLRFSPIMDPPPAKAHLEELEFITGRPSKSDGECESVGWVSEMCARAIILGLLALLTGDHEGDISKALRACSKDVRASGFQLNKIWSCLDALRQTVVDITVAQSSGSSDDLFIPLTFPDPRPPPSQQNTRTTRNASSSSSVNVVQTSQLIPVIVSLVHSALETAALREDIDQGIKDSRDWGRNARDALRLESEQWEVIKKGMEVAPKDKDVKAENREKRQQHKDRVAKIENSSRLVAPAYAPRFAPLGTDEDGRIYYALTAGASEREAAYEFVEAKTKQQRIRLKKKCRVPSADERAELREWSWFIAVWGRRPDQVLPENGMDVDSDAGSEEDADAERWWCFWEEDEIRKLADWVAIKGDLDEDSDSSQKGDDSNTPTPQASEQSQLKALVTGLRDYASLLHWRTGENRYGESQANSASVGGTGNASTSGSARGKRAISPVPADRFYS